MPRRVWTVPRVKRGFSARSLGFAISDTMTAKVEAPKIERLITNERNPLKDLITTSAVLAPFGVMVCVAKELAGTGSVLVTPSS
jgi:hypothetical protein